MTVKFKKTVSLVLTALLALSLFSVAALASDGTSNELQFNSDGKFTILNMSDIQDDSTLMSITKTYIEDTLKRVNPDLVVLTGDNISGGNPTKALAKAAINQVMSIFESFGVKVAIVFGNHDDQDTTATKEYQMSCYEQYSCFIGCAGEDMSGVGTYNLPILSSDGSHYAFNLWLIDSGNYNNENDLGGYACVQKDQIEWYKATAEALKAQNGGKTVPSMEFQHIIVPEIFDALTEVEAGTEGSISRNGKSYVLPVGSKGALNEGCCPPNYSNGQFAAMVEQGDVIACFSGHDHVNTFEVDYQGIKICNTPGMGFKSYNDENVGSRVIVLDEESPNSFETYCLSYFDIYSEDDAVASNRYYAYSDTSSSATKFTIWLKYIFAVITSVFKFSF